MDMIIVLKCAALTHLGLLAAGALMPKAVNLWTHIKDLPPFIRCLFKVYYVFIGFMLASFGLLTWIYAEELASGVPLARAVKQAIDMPVIAVGLITDFEQAEAIIGKQRHGPIGTVEMHFEGKFTRFGDLAQPIRHGSGDFV